MTLTEHAPLLRRAIDDDGTDVARILAAAFMDDPVFQWLVPEAAERAPMLAPLFAVFTGAFARHDETHVAVVGEAVAGVSMWSPPGVAPVHADDEASLGEALVGITGEHMARVATCMEIFDAAHPHEPAWFLQFLGVDPRAQGAGVGSVLLREVLARADAAGEAAYLEATSPRNRALYERHGFRCVGELRLPDGPAAYAMWRDPAPFAAA
jgi:ribosomal protein S18 acetylase RimI-like enzyme